MVQVIDLAYQWPRFAVAFFSVFGILSGFDGILYDGLLRSILELRFNFSSYVPDYIFGVFIIIINLVSFLAAVVNSNRSRASLATLSVYLLLVHFLTSPFVWFLLTSYRPWDTQHLIWFMVFLQLLTQFVFLCFRAWATIVMWRDTRSLARNTWGALVNEDGHYEAIVHPAPVQLP
ncbi:hypothetical protein BGZ95_007331 [Linnemannia exigua]|uniref:Uncharacterized protein n=1 Tax=Linnemannia exigua TaxID=604196 RepID=A0AAD4DHD7_9FUNG|nr:hypothetical protein BGZ95_007331 [Linnemannia exigua]